MYINNNKIFLREYISFIKGKKPKKFTTSGNKYLTIDVLENSSLLYADSANTICCNKNDILMVMDGASSGKVYIGNNGIVGSTLAKIVCNNINPYYCYIYLKNNYNYISGHNIGSAIPHTNKELVMDMSIACQRLSNLIYNNLFELRISINDNINLLNKIKSMYLKKFFG